MARHIEILSLHRGLESVNRISVLLSCCYILPEIFFSAFTGFWILVKSGRFPEMALKDFKICRTGNTK